MKTIASKLGLVLFAGAVAAVFIAATTSVSGNNRITGRVVINKAGTYTVDQNINLLNDNNSSSVITVTVGGVVVDCDGHELAGPSASPVIDIALPPGSDQLVVLRDCRLTGGLDGVRSTNANARYENMLITEAVAHGVDATDSDVQLVHSQIRMSGVSAVHVTGAPGYDWLVEDSTIAGTGGNAIDAHGQGSLTVRRSTIRNAGGCGLMITNDDSQPGSGLTVEDSTVIGTVHDGYHVLGEAPVSIRGGRVRMIGHHGVNVIGSNQPVSVRDLAAQDVGTLALRIHSGGPTEITGNRIRMVGQDAAFGGGIEIDGSGGPAQSAVISNNMISKGGVDSCGIRLLPGTSARVLDNIVANITYGISSWTHDALIERNQIRRVDVAGIRVFGHGNAARENVVYGKMWFGGLSPNGILVGPDGHGNIIEDNQIAWFTTGLEIQTTGGDDSFFRDNLLVGNTTAVIGGTDAGGNILP